ncbi:translin-associated factor X-interacting protein 1-like isoform X2 [Acipenser ruthenus]|uniref:translin-associated factor X-interacting protein 1-like isoform X2 n=1 Tax=Acipenser ruthenus TaxID=7906 RepID=UPI001560CC60|nr:translin-associated factor X-interacting protein 1-like isoform X2 [Acipenser ruthenus]
MGFSYRPLSCMNDTMQRDGKLPTLQQVSERESPHYPSSSLVLGLRHQQQSNHTKLKGAVGESCTGHLSTWPAHLSSQIVPQRRKPHSPTENKIHGCGEEFSSSVSKPRFLEQLETYLRKELQSLDPSKPNAQELKLQAYQEVFEYFIEDFKTYKPLLSAIKNEYDITLAYLRDQIRTLEPLKAMVVTVSEQCNQKILALREDERAEIKALKQEKVQLLKRIDQLRENQLGLQAQLARMQEDLAHQYLLYRDEADSRKLLISEINEMRFLEDDLKHLQTQVVAVEDPVKMKLALKVAREDLTRLQVELNCMKADYGEVVPRRDFTALEKNHKEALAKKATLQKDFDQLKEEYDTLLDIHKQVSDQRDKVSTQLEHIKGRLTPRPQWQKCAEVVSGGDDRWHLLSEGLSSDQLVDVLLAEIGGKDIREKEFFDGLGKGDAVPVYLRYEGTIKNLKLKKIEIVDKIKDIWKEKVPADQQKGERRSLDEFFHEYLQKKHADSASKWAYSIQEGCRLYRDDDFINLFFNILTGKVDEGVYHGQIHLISHLLKELMHSDSSEKGSLSKEKFRQALSRAFPLKNQEQIEELIQAAESQQGHLEDLNTINYEVLFSEFAEDQVGNFLTLLRKQATAEKQKYLAALTKELGSRTEVKVADLRTAFQSIDPTVDPQTVERYICLAFQMEKEDLEQAAPVDVNSAMQRLLAADVKRTGPGPKED